MRWNWELPDWPKFVYYPHKISQKERQFLLGVGSELAFLKSVASQEYNQFVVEILSVEGIESSRIEGEILDRESLQSSIKQHFGINTDHKQEAKKESRMAKLICNVYETFDQPLTHEMLWQWHSNLFNEQPNIIDCGKYRSHLEPMQIISNRYDSPKVFFEAPPSAKIYDEMSVFIDWFNSTSLSEPILGRAAIAHVYFESIHPFEDGNGRIGRLLVEKILSQGVERPILIAVSKVLEKRKKEYYTALESCNRTLEVEYWVEFFTDVVLQAQGDSMSLLYFLIEKTKLFTMLSGQLNPRQEKVLLRMFEEGLTGFKGGLSAKNYITITKASRATATRDLADLVEKKALVKNGELRHTRYTLNLPNNGNP
ncbi:MAG: Fic family protein [Parachlamydiaceae bacterium]|nr:Fic family protein [Parachlamydiaceae bacterium]